MQVTFWTLTKGYEDDPKDAKYRLCWNLDMEMMLKVDVCNLSFDYARGYAKVNNDV